MDESNKTAEATRKRRSSILKSQRPHRTPFSELEFNVTTPDTTKSRRVSFSRKTGVAEFATNEATTSWKNVYEEQHKSLETSSNDSGHNAQGPPPITQLGRCMFDQFEEVEALDVGDIIQTHSLAQDFQNSLLNNVNFEQLAGFECTGEKLTVPKQNFEISEFTEQKSKLFCDDLTVPTMPEISNKINVDFSLMQDKCDDLDEMQKDLNRTRPKVIGPTAFGNASDYIEIDLNKSHVVVQNDDDMSITDTIHSPKVQELSKSISNKSLSYPKFEDKENIAINPYAPICETNNFAVNEVDDNVLVFDGKKLTVQKEKKSICQNVSSVNPRRTIVINTDDDLPNFIPVPKQSSTNILENPVFENSVPKIKNIEGNNPKRNTIVFENDMCDISMTQALPARVIESGKTVVYDEDIDISTTQAVPANIIIENKNDVKEKTILYDNGCDISLTQAVPVNILNSNEIKSPEIKESRRQTIVFQNNCDVSFTQVIPSNIINSKPRKSNIVKKEKGNTVLHDNDGDISITQAVPTNILIKTINDILPMETKTQDINVCEGNIKETLEKGKELNTFALEDSIPKIAITEVSNIMKPKRNTMIFKDDMCDISMTQAVPAKVIENRKTIVYDNDMDVSTTQPVPTHIIDTKNNTEKRKTIIYENDCDISMTQAVPTEILNHSERKPIEIKENKRETIVFQNNCDTSFTQVIPANIIKLNEETTKNNIKEEKAENIIDDKKGDVSVTQVLPTNILSKTINDGFPAETQDIKVNQEHSEDLEKEEDNPCDTNNDNDVSMNDDVFIIKRDSFVEEAEELRIKSEIPALDNETPALEYKEEENIIDDLNNKLQDLKTETKNRRLETVVSTGKNYQDLDCSNIISNTTVSRKSIKNADDTRELLQMISDFTDRPVVPPTIDEEKEQSIQAKDHTIKAEEISPEPKRISFAPRRSIVFSEEDLLDNISMPQAVLQQSQSMHDSEIDNVADMSIEMEEINRNARKSLRISSEVVKTLKFDETVEDNDLHRSPLKKTAFGETSYMNESKEKSKVIPTYDVTDGIKELMNDLVKPMADVIPFESGNLDRSAKKSPSTVSTQIQANLTTSSQIDLDEDLHSNRNSGAELAENKSFVQHLVDMGGQALASVMGKDQTSEVSTEELQKSQISKTARCRPSVPGEVIVFDHTNPLNNVLLSPRDASAHPYNPIKSDDTIHSEHDASIQLSKTSVEKNTEKENVTAQYNVQIASGDTAEKVSNISVTSKPLSIDRSVEMKLNMRETEVNTEIAMKPNTELLDAHSSLTLVDDALARSTFEVDLDTDNDGKKSPVRVIYKMYQNGVLSEKIESDLTSTDGDYYESIQTNPKKRSLSPNNGKTEQTPKPQSKMQKCTEEGRKSPQKKLKKTRNSPRKSITVQQLMTEFKMTEKDQIEIEDEVNKSIEAMSLDSDGKSLFSCKSTIGSEKSDTKTLGSEISKLDFNNGVSAQSSNEVVEDCESSANVVAKIDMLPFMGSRDCQWEQSSTDTWSFLLMRGHMRVTVKLAHSHLNASRSRVRADTALKHVAVEPLHNEEKDPLLSLFLRLTTDAMRHQCGRKCSRAGDVPALLRRCVHVSNLAVKWLRIMKDTKMRLAYKIDKTGYCTLKVANIPLRSVWELGLHIDLVIDDALQTAWPRAGDVSVRSIVADVDVDVQSLQDVLDSVPRNWVHVPKTIWTLFKHLKNKTNDDELFGLQLLRFK